MIEFTLPVQIIWKAPLQFNGPWLISKMGDNADDSITWKDNVEPSVSQSQKSFFLKQKIIDWFDEIVRPNGTQNLFLHDVFFL